MNAQENIWHVFTKFHLKIFMDLERHFLRTLHVTNDSKLTSASSATIQILTNGIQT
jgi:hypothetical protein